MEDSKATQLKIVFSIWCQINGAAVFRSIENCLAFVNDGGATEPQVCASPYAFFCLSC